MIRTLLIANRAEIAVRIAETAARLGIATVAVHPADDAACAHVTRADRAVLLPGTGVAAYLDAEAVVAAAAEAGADAVHPGYGFLSENAELARRCAEKGIAFVGPSPEALELFGDKTRSRDRAAELGIPVLAGTAAPTDLATATAFFDEHGTVMVKAVAGGGGRGMRPVFDRAELAEALTRCSAEAQAAFGDGRVHVERLLRAPRHVEVQVLGDGHATVVLGDRDCSVQRRRQKLIEIAPAPALAPGVRERLHAWAAQLTGSLPYAGLATVEFLVEGDEAVFLEVNPRLQVEHPVTEEVTGLDLVELALRVAGGARLTELGLTATPPSRGAALEARVNTETVGADGSVTPGGGTLTRFQPPSGRGVRVDTHGYAGYPVSPRYDSLLAKVIVTGADVPAVAAGAARALAEFDIAGTPTTIGLLQALLAEPGLATGALDTTYVDTHVAELSAVAPRSRLPVVDTTDAPVRAAVPEDAVVAPQTGVIVEILVAPGAEVATGAELVVIEAMKMQFVVRAPGAGTVGAVVAAVGDVVDAGAPLLVLHPSDAEGAAGPEATETDPAHVRPDLAEALERHRIGLDEARPAMVERRHAAGKRTARENVADLVDEGSFVEYGALTIAAQRRRRSVEDLIAASPADGLLTGTATVDGTPIALLAYDYSVMAGTQGNHNHKKSDRILRVAAQHRLPVVLFAEGGGGRPGDTDASGVAHLDVPTFRMAAQLSGRVPSVAIVSGYCFAGNAALAGACDLIVATEGSSLGMGGPAMIEGGGLGVVAPGDVGPMDVQTANGVVDVLVADEAEAVAVARRYLGYATGAHVPGTAADQRRLRHLVPENRVRGYDVRPVLDVLFDEGSVLELRPRFGIGVVTALARLDGRPVGVLANNPLHLGGAIDADAADKAARFLRLCDGNGLPVVSLCDTPGFMVGPDAERTGTVRRFGDLFVAGARLTVPLCAVVLRKAYGLGAMAMTGGDLQAPTVSVAWPTGEFGGMGLEGAVRLGYRKELEAIADPAARETRFAELVADYYERGKALSIATVYEIDDVIDPADTREVLTRTLAAATSGPFVG